MEPLLKASSTETNIMHEVHINSNELESINKPLKIIDPLSHYSLGLAYQAYGELEKSIEYFENSISHDLEEINVFTDLGIAYYTKGDLTKSYDYFKQAIINDPKDAIAFIGLGIIYHEQNNIDKANNYFDKAKELCPVLEKDINTLFMNY